VIENLDWREVIERYDSAEALFYLDPPYWGSEALYVPGAFNRDQFAQIAASIRSMKGKAIVSLNDVPEIREIFAGFRLEEAVLPYTISQASGGPKEANEVLIYNFARPALPLFG